MKLFSLHFSILRLWDYLYGASQNPQNPQNPQNYETPPMTRGRLGNRHGKEGFLEPPNETLKHDTITAVAKLLAECDIDGLRLGQRVIHAKFGEGVILQSEGSGDRARVQINFTSAGAKWLMLSYANLETLD